MMNPGQEQVVIVDEQDRERGSVSRREMRAQGLIHRASYILVFNSRQELFVQKRTMSKDIYPGYYDVAAGGVVLAHESYEESARRELFEELGIKGCDLAFHFKHYYANLHNRVWGAVFSCTWDGPMILQQEEVASGSFMHPAAVMSLSRVEPFTPDGIEILGRLVDLQE